MRSVACRHAPVMPREPAVRRQAGTMSTEAAHPRASDFVIARRPDPGRDARRRLWRQPVPAQFDRRDRAQSGDRTRPVGVRNRIAGERVLLFVCGRADPARRCARPLRPAPLHAGLRGDRDRRRAAVRLGAVARLADHGARADGARLLLLFHGAACALCEALSAGPVCDAGRLPIGLGTLGTLLATAPFACAVAAIGWRALLRRDRGCDARRRPADRDRDPRRPAGAGPREARALRESFTGMLAATRVPSFWPLFAMHFVTYSSFVIVVGLWGGPYLTHIYGYSLTERGNMLLVAVVAQVVGALLWGPTDRWFKSYKVPVMAGALLTAAAMATGAMVGVFPPVGLLVWFVAIGLHHRLSAGPDRARQVAVSSGTGRTRNHAAEYRHHGRRFRLPERDRIRHRPVSRSGRGVCAGCISLGFRLPDRRYPIGMFSLF